MFNIIFKIVNLFMQFTGIHFKDVNSSIQQNDSCFLGIGDGCCYPTGRSYPNMGRLEQRPGRS